MIAFLIIWTEGSGGLLGGSGPNPVEKFTTIGDGLNLINYCLWLNENPKVGCIIACGVEFYDYIAELIFSKVDLRLDGLIMTEPPSLSGLFWLSFLALSNFD